MALIKCQECGKEISDKAVVCPNCGNPIQCYIDSDAYDMLSNYKKKKCSRCGRDIPKRIGRCPYCGKNQNVLAGVAGIAIIILIVWRFIF